MSIKCAIFDFDGTLYDSMYIWDDLGEKYLKSLGKQAKPGLKKELEAMSLEQSSEYLKSEYGLYLTKEEIKSGINKTLENYYINEVLPKQGVEKLLKQMKEKGISICIASATDRYLLEVALKRCGLYEYFEAIFTCGEVGFGKDRPVIFQKAMEYFSQDRKSTIIFEDAIHAARTAKNDNFIVCGVFDEYEKESEELRKISDIYLKNLEETEKLWDFLSTI